MNEETEVRERAQNALRRYFEKRSSPRIILSLLLILAGSFAFLVSFISLHSGVEQMWLRYPVAVLAGYAFFLGLLRIWVEIERSRFDPREAELEALLVERRSSVNESSTLSRRSWLDWLDLSNFVDVDEGCLPVLLLILVIGLVFGVAALLVSLVAAAPALLAEIFLDAVIVSMLYRRLRIAAKEHWLGTAIRRTWWRVVIVAAFLSLGGWALEEFAPGTHSIGPAIEKILYDRFPRSKRSS